MQPPVLLIEPGLSDAPESCSVAGRSPSASACSRRKGIDGWELCYCTIASSCKISTFTSSSVGFLGGLEEDWIKAHLLVIFHEACTQKLRGMKIYIEFRVSRFMGYCGFGLSSKEARDVGSEVSAFKSCRGRMINAEEYKDINV